MMSCLTAFCWLCRDAEDTFYDRTEGQQRRKRVVEVEALDAATLLGQKVLKLLCCAMLCCAAMQCAVMQCAGLGQLAAGSATSIT